jgi:hypothetical protein
MVTVSLIGKTSQDISNIVNDLKNSGLKINVDFDFYFNTGKFDWSTGSNLDPVTYFNFYNEKDATWFTLVYKTK